VARTPKGRKPRKTTTFRFSERDEWFIEALREQVIYGETATEVIRTALHLLIEKAQTQDKRLPLPPKRSAKEIPPAAKDE
jgi:Arc/MetJ-type ribon-helix-helix transcriptional regulator